MMKIFSSKRRSLLGNSLGGAPPDFRAVPSVEVLKTISDFENSIREKSIHWSRNISAHYLHIRDKFKQKHSSNPISFENLASFKSIPDLGIHAFHSGVAPSARQTVWPYLLSVYPLNLSPIEKMRIAFKIDIEYTEEKFLWQSNSDKSKAIYDLVYKDVDRTDRTNPYFQVPNDHPHFIKLYNITATYISVEVSDHSQYAQGLTDIISVFVILFESESLAYACLREFMRAQLQLFKPETHGFPARCALLASLIETLDPEFYRFLEANDASNMLFTYRWFLLDLKREFTFDQSLKVFETIIATRLLATQQRDTDQPQSLATTPSTLSADIKFTAQMVESKEINREWYLEEAYKDMFTLFLAYQLLSMYKREFMKKRISMPEMCEFYSEATGSHNFEAILKGAKNLFSQYICENLTFEPDKENDYVYI